jgi:polyhydroxybutyrate depolymerase
LTREQENYIVIKINLQLYFLSVQSGGEMKNLRVPLLTISIFILYIIIAACNQIAATPVPTAAPTATIPPTATAPPTIEPGYFTRKLMANNVERSYLLHIPPGLNSNQPVPILFTFHGAQSVPAEIEVSTGFDDIADKASFLVVYPRSVGLSWNISCCGYAPAKDTDDPAFVRQILSDLETIANVDSKRIYATGFSTGALLVYQLACEMSEVFAGIAPVAGSMAYSPCQPQEPVSLIHLHGLEDDIIPYEGGGDFDTPPVEEVIAAWVKFDGCTGSPQTDKPNKIIKHTAYSSCKAGTAVELYAIDFSGHAWQNLTAWSGSQAIWDFFAAHPKP